jgi:5-methyltetrahydrofolate--homocysteine methyltransferase
MAIGAWMTSAITNPLHPEVVAACMGADLIMGRDSDCMSWIRRFREPPQPGAEGEAGRGRRVSRRRRG